jgi:hypothetical protein
MRPTKGGGATDDGGWGVALTPITTKIFWGTKVVDTTSHWR